MLSAIQWWNEWEGAKRPLLVLGDGPTLARRGEFDLDFYARIALSGAAEIGETDAIFFADWEAARTQASQAMRQARFLLVPLAGSESAQSTPALKDLDAQGRLIGYDAGAAGREGAGTLIHLLGTLGAKNIRTLGVDYGLAPTPEAGRLRDGIAAAIQKFGLSFGPLTAETPARIFIGADPSQMLGAKILEYSIRRHSTLTTEFDTMQQVAVPMPKNPQNQPRTQFSFSRFAIPALAGYHGRALYLDADMLVFGDLRELWELPFGDSTAMYAPPSNPARPKQTSVMLMDCDRLTWDLDAIVRDLDEERYDYDGLMRDMKLEPERAVQPRVPTAWNSLEEYVPGETRLLHYTDMKYQPWVSRRNPNGDLWVTALCDALQDGFVTLPEVKQAIRDGYVRPSLLWQLRVPPARWGWFRKNVAPVLDVRHKPHRGLRKRLKSAKIGIS